MTFRGLRKCLAALNSFESKLKARCELLAELGEHASWYMLVSYCREIDFDGFVGDVLSCEMSDEESFKVVSEVDSVLVLIAWQNVLNRCWRWCCKCIWCWMWGRYWRSAELWAGGHLCWVGLGCIYASRKVGRYLLRII